MTTTDTPARSWRDERRQDRLTSAQIERDRQGADAERQIAERKALAEIRRGDDQAWRDGRRQARQARREARLEARQARAARRAELAGWAREHAIDLLFVPVIGIPAVLAWTAMGAYGFHVYGVPGLALPAMSEGSMWAFAVATTLTRRRYPGRPVWHLRLGTLVFALIGATLNFVHGVAVANPATGALMAVVSVAGVTAHQLVTAGPRRSRAERAAARLERAVRRREMTARRAAVRRAVAELDEDGNAYLVYEPGTVRLSRRFGFGRIRLATIHILDTGPALPPPPVSEAALAVPEVTPDATPAPEVAHAISAPGAAEVPPAPASAPGSFLVPPDAAPVVLPAPAPEVAHVAPMEVTPVPAPEPEIAPDVPPAPVFKVAPAPVFKAPPEVTPDPDPDVPAAPGSPVPEGTRRPRPPEGTTPGKQPGPVTPERLREHYAADLAAGNPPSIRQIRREWPVGYDRASELHDHLMAAELAPA